MWKLEHLVEYTSTVQKFVNDKWVPDRPLNGTIKYASLKQRIKDAYSVLMCKAEAFTWPEGQ